MVAREAEVGDESIDDSLYSRQRYVLGDAAMKRMAASNVFLSGLGGTGIEIAKNVALAGIRALTLHDKKSCTVMDLGAQFYVTEKDVEEGTTRLEVSAAKLAELNPYVRIETSKADLGRDDLSFLDDFKVVVVTDSSLAVLRRVNAYCHERNIGFIAADVRGVFCYSFVDLGTGFEVLDSTGEKPKNFLIGRIEATNPLRVHSVANHRHDLQSGDRVSFTDLEGTPFAKLAGESHTVKVDSPFSFTLGEFKPEGIEEECIGRGQATEVKVPVLHNFKCLQDSLKEPDLVHMDLAKFEAPRQQHVAFQALWAFEESNGRLPEPWNESDAEAVLSFAETINNDQQGVEKVDSSVVKALAHTARGQLSPLAAFVGGVVGQEVLKAISGKFTPIHQWLYLEAMDVLPKNASGLTAPSGKRTDSLQVCVGERGVKAVASSRLFMVGAGAIGCEMIKNLAMLGACIKEAGGKIVVTDNDLIERSNLNRQFLFRSKDINRPKSVTAAAAAVAMNAGIAVDPRTDKMGPDTVKLYPDAFFSSQHMIVNALDNLQARLFMDARAVSNQLPLIDSGTLGAKGHVQVVLPHQSESYASQRDPETADIAYCTLKSFPSSMDHCIVWARDLLFEDYFRVKPSDYQLFQASERLEERLREHDPELLKGVVSVAAMVKHRPSSFGDCVAFGRVMFEEFYRNNAAQLLDAFPLDHKAADGTLFWSNPKRPPTPLEFDVKDEMHASFVYQWASLWAAVWNVAGEKQSEALLTKACSSAKVPVYKSKKVKIETDESAKAPKEEVDPDELKEKISLVLSHFENATKTALEPQVFEKDVDENHHIAFITAAANLRARVYGIAEANRIEVKRIAGNITPAIATTTSAVSGLVTLELLKQRLGCSFEEHRNTSLSLALPFFQQFEPSPAPRVKLTEALETTLWDRWDVYGNESFTLQNLFDHFSKHYHIDVEGVVQGSSMIYLKGLHMMHKSKLPKAMADLVSDSTGDGYVDLVVTFRDGNREIDEVSPPVRYHFSSTSKPHNYDSRLEKLAVQTAPKKSSRRQSSRSHKSSSSKAKGSVATKSSSSKRDSLSNSSAATGADRKGKKAKSKSKTSSKSKSKTERAESKGKSADSKDRSADSKGESSSGKSRAHDSKSSSGETKSASSSKSASSKSASSKSASNKSASSKSASSKSASSKSASSKSANSKSVSSKSASSKAQRSN